MTPSSLLFGQTGPLIALAVKKIVESIGQSDASTTSALKEEAERAQIKANVLLAQAKVEQELAISRRIDCADEVEIEEFYDVTGKGHAGAKTEGESISLGVGAEGRRVTKRVIKFKGGAPVTSSSEISEA